MQLDQEKTSCSLYFEQFLSFDICLSEQILIKTEKVQFFCFGAEINAAPVKHLQFGPQKLRYAWSVGKMCNPHPHPRWKTRVGIL